MNKMKEAFEAYVSKSIPLGFATPYEPINLVGVSVSRLGWHLL